MRFCAKCEHLFIGGDIKLTEDEDGNIHFHCPTLDCQGTWIDWEYPSCTYSRNTIPALLRRR
jgi:hypothetical protein